MLTLLWISLLAWAGICCIWIGLLVAQYRARRDGLMLLAEPRRRAQGDRSEGDHPSVCVVIPARNESTALATCLEQVLAQDYTALSVVVVDDRSDDDTAEVAETFVRRDPRVRLERIESLPPGWMGKSHALWRATRHIQADWLLFIDVDCALEPCAVRLAVEETRRRDAELLSLWPRQAAGGFWEHLTIPLCAGIIALWYGSPGINDAGRELAFANGVFLLISRRGYEQMGGHRAVRDALIEDIPFAHAAKKAGLRCWMASGANLIAVRMYENYSAILNGWARIYVGAIRSGTKIALSMLWLLAGSLWPFIAAAVLGIRLIGMRAGGGTVDMVETFLIVLCGLHLVLIFVASYRFWGMGRCRRSYLVLYPLSVLVVLRILGRAWWWLIVRRRIPWRETYYAIDRKGTIIGQARSANEEKTGPCEA